MQQFCVVFFYNSLLSACYPQGMRTAHTAVIKSLALYVLSDQEIKTTAVILIKYKKKEIINRR